MHIDALTRIVAAVGTISLEKELQYRLSDPRIRTILDHLEESEYDKFILIEGLVYKKDDEKPRFYVPDCMITNILRVYYDNNAHCGVKKVIQGLRNDYWFPSMHKQAQSYVDNCLVCLVVNSSANTKEDKLQLPNFLCIPYI